ATGAFEDLTVANWATYVITMTETPASSYGYVGTWPAGLTTVGWYIVDVYDGATIAGTLAGTLLGYWDGTNYVLGGADAREISGDAAAADNCELMFDGTGYAGGTIVFQSDLTKIHGTAITETATQLAGAFTKFFDVAAPTGTVNSIPDAVAGAAGGLLIAGSNAGTTTFSALTVTNATTLTGAVSLGSTLGVTGAVTFSSTFATGAVTLSALTVTNATTLTGAVSLGSTLGVTGAVTFSSTFATGAVTLSGLAITNALSVGTTTTLTGAVSLGSTLGVTGATTFTGAVGLSSTLTVAGALSLGPTTLTGAALTAALTIDAGEGTAAIALASGGFGMIWDTDTSAEFIGQANVAKWLGTAAHAATVAGVPVVQLHNSAGGGGINAPANFEDLAIVDTTGLVTYANTAPPTADAIKTAIEAEGSYLALILADTGTDGVVVASASKTGFKLASDGLAAVTVWTVDITGTVSGNSTHSAASVGSIDIDSGAGTLTLSSALESLVAVVLGVAAYDSGTGVATFKKRDGLTTKATVTVGDNGTRSVSTIS
ncbi:MAG TPA: hypothetical protein VM243_02495, partial [Phycisphaerae bacterium]|nr:hypothetical protein [Phycisphaerae bacterium]